jgi:hypothetical protein
MGRAEAGPTQEKFHLLSPKEVTFLRFVYNGDEAKAVEYAQLAGINPDSMADEPLSVWFYDMDELMAPGMHRDVRVHKIVFDRFKQNPNPPLRDVRGMQSYCSYAPMPHDFNTQWNGTNTEKQLIANAQWEALKKHVDVMTAGFDSLRKYGLTDRGILTAMLTGCVFPNPGDISEYVYDHLATKLVKAGADINQSGSQFGRPGRPIELVVQRANVPVLQRLLHDGAQVRFAISNPCGGKGTDLYGYLLNGRPPNFDQVVQMVGLLTAAGLPADRPITAAAGFGSTYCHPTTIYDEALTAGNLDFAKALKVAMATPAVQAAPALVSSAQTDVSASVPAAMAVDPVKPTKFGAWSITADPSGRPVAASPSVNAPDVTVRRLQLECAVGGRLEYVPISAKATALNSLWVSGMDDAQSELPVVNGRLSGKSAAWLSQAFLKAEASAAKSGQAKWGLSVVADNPNIVAVTDVDGAGFSQMRSYMLAHCKS